MSTITDFDIANDLKVEFYIPGGNSNDFIIGVSRLGGPDVLAYEGFIVGISLLGGEDVLATDATGFVWTDLNCITTRAELSVGGQIQDQLYFQPQPGQASLVLQSFDYDPNFSPAFRPGINVRVRLVRDELDEIIWQGIVDSINGSYDKDGNNLLSITAYDVFKRIVNARIPIFDSETGFPGYVTSYEQLELIAEQFGTAMHSSSSDPGGLIPSQLVEQVIPNQLIFEAIQVGLGIFWIDPGTGEFVFVPRPPIGEAPEGTPIIGNNHGEPNHLCITDIQTSMSEDTIYNSLKVTLASNEAISTLRENPDSIELYGISAQDVTLNVIDSIELDDWANLVFKQYPTSTIDSVETLTKDRNGTLTEAAFFLPGIKVGVDFTEDIIAINEFFTVTKVSHSIDPDNWLTTLELWKEA